MAMQLTGNNNNNNSDNNNNNDDDDSNNITIAWEGAVRDFTISSLRREPSPTRTFGWPERNGVQMTCNTLNAYHVARRDSSAVKFDRVEIAFNLALFYWLKRLADGTCNRVPIFFFLFLFFFLSCDPSLVISKGYFMGKFHSV